MSYLQLLIDNIDVSEYVNRESLQDFTVKVEGDELWSYYADSISTSIDKSVLSLFNLTEITAHEMYQKPVSVKYYGTVVFTGIITDISYDLFDGILDIRIGSWLKIIKDITIPKLKTIGYGRTADGVTPPDTVSIFLFNFSLQLNGELIEKEEYDYRIHNTSYLPDRDFDILKSFEVEVVNIPTNVGDYEFKETWFEGFCTFDASKATNPSQYTSIDGNPYAVWIDGYTNTPQPWRLAEVTTNGINTTSDPLRVDITNADVRKFRSNVDASLLDYLRGNVTTTSETTNIENAVYLQGDNSWYVYTSDNLAYKVTLSDEDQLNYYYSGSNAGEILKDIGVLTNTYIDLSIGQNLTLRGREDITDNLFKKAEQIKYTVIDKGEGKVELSDGMGKYIPQYTKSRLLDYYDDYLEGKFIKYNILVNRDKFSASELPLMFKKFYTLLNNRRIDCGIIREVTYGEHIVELTTEKRIE